MNIFLDANDRSVPRPYNKKVSWRISGYAIIEDRGRILVVVPTWNDRFELPGGGVEERETIKDGIMRECYEETGYKIDISDVIPLYVGEENFYHRHHRKFYHSLISIYRAKLRNRKQDLKVINTRDGNEISKIIWNDLSMFNSRNTHRIFYPVIQRLQKSKNLLI